MPNIKSAIKRVKVSKKKNLRNRMVKSGVKTAVKKYQAALAEGVAPAGAQLSATTSAIDKAVSKGVMHKNTANRKRPVWPRRLPKPTLNCLPHVTRFLAGFLFMGVSKWTASSPSTWKRPTAITTA
ncbi:MAG: 30S ribosomal protein S20 [Deltaproteobacteria bacterium]|nr:30S ribosomal protein S20 [Deltaproteobacteria bacterium]